MNTTISGLPFRNNDRTTFLPTDLFPIEGDVIPEGKNGWLVLLDEYNHARPEMIRASYKLILDRYVGASKLHEDVYIVLAGNPVDSNALANDIGTAANSRLIHLTLGNSHSEWLKNVALPFKYDYRIIGFLNEYPDKLNDFNPEVTDKSFCCNRTWEFMNTLVDGVDDLDPIAPALAGAITPGVAFEFIQYCKIYDQVPTVKEILDSPHKCRLPDDSAGRWAVATKLVQHTEPENLKKVLEYIWRLKIENKIIFMRMLLTSNSSIATHEDFGPYFEDFSRYVR